MMMMMMKLFIIRTKANRKTVTNLSVNGYKMFFI